MAKQVDIVYYCDVRKKHFKRKALIDDSLEVERQLCNVVFMTRTFETGHKGVLVKSVMGKKTGTRTGFSASVPGLLFGKEYERARRKTDDPWNFTKEAFDK